MRVLVCGGRDFADQSYLNYRLKLLHKATPISVLIQGGARGADSLAKTWAIINCVKVLEFPADWETHGKSAGPIRNAQMLLEGKPDLVVAFKGGVGTRDMVRRAQYAGIRCIGYTPH